MGKGKSTGRKTPSPAKEVAEVSVPSPEMSANVTIRVIKAHDGLNAGETFIKPRELAYMMQEAGFWEII